MRQNLSKHLAKVKEGESLVVTERGQEVARMVPSGPGADRYALLASRYGSTLPRTSLRKIAAGLRPPGAAAGTTDAALAESRRERS